MPGSRFSIPTPFLLASCATAKQQPAPTAAPKSESASCNMEALCSCFPGGRPTHPPQLRLCIHPARTPKHGKVTYSTVPGQGPLGRPCALFWDCTLCISLHAADDAPVISHSGLPGTLLHLQRAVPWRHCCLHAARSPSQSRPDDACQTFPGSWGL